MQKQPCVLKSFFVCVSAAGMTMNRATGGGRGTGGQTVGRGPGRDRGLLEAARCRLQHRVAIRGVMDGSCSK